MPELLTGIQIDELPPFEEWGLKVALWLGGVGEDVRQGTCDDIGELKARQDRYTAYQGYLVEIFSKADVYYKNALAKAMERRVENKTPSSLIARIAEQDCWRELLLYNTAKQLNNTLSDQLIAIASRLKFEGGPHTLQSGAPF